jgi:hypothetical protein
MRTGLQKHEAKAKHTIPRLVQGSTKETGHLWGNKSVDNDKEEIANQSIHHGANGFLTNLAYPKPRATLGRGSS